MKIGYICSSGDLVRGGGAASVHIQEICLAWQELGHEVFIVAAHKGEEENEGQSPLKVYKVGTIPRRQRFYHTIWRKFYSSPAGPAHRAKGLSDQDENKYAYGKLFTPSWSSVYVWRDLDQLWETISFERHFYNQATRIFDLEQPDVLYQRYSRYGFSGVRLARKYRLPMILEMNGSLTFPREWFWQPSFLYPLLIRRSERKLCAQADKVIASSPYLRRYLIQTGVSPSKVKVITNGVNLANFTYRSQEVASIKRKYKLDGKIVVGFVGYFRRYHDLDILIDSIHLVNRQQEDVHFLIVGDGHQGKRLRHRVQSEALADKVTFAGRVSRQDIASYIYAIDIAASPLTSSSGSGLALKLFEYMAAGRAVIATRLQDTDYVIADRQNGLLVKHGNAREMAAAILELAGDEHLRNQLGKDARRTVENKYTWEHNAQALIDIYNRICSN